MICSVCDLCVLCVLSVVLCSEVRVGVGVAQAGVGVCGDCQVA